MISFEPHEPLHKVSFNITNFEKTEFMWFDQNYLAMKWLEPKSYKFKSTFAFP